MEFHEISKDEADKLARKKRDYNPMLDVLEKRGQVEITVDGADEIRSIRAGVFHGAKRRGFSISANKTKQGGLVVRLLTKSSPPSPKSPKSKSSKQG